MPVAEEPSEDRGKKIKQILDSLPREKNLKVLDIGPGDGGFLGWLPENYEKCAVDVIQRKISGVTVKIADMNKDEIPFPDAYFDVVICCEVIEHLWNADNLLFQINRKLRKGGIVILSTPNMTGLSSRLQMLTGKIPGVQGQGISLAERPGNHVRCYNPPALRYLFELYGFSVSKMDGATSKGFFIRRLLEKYPPLSLFVVMTAVKEREAKPVRSVDDGKIHFEYGGLERSRKHA